MFRWFLVSEFLSKVDNMNKRISKFLITTAYLIALIIGISPFIYKSKITTVDPTNATYTIQGTEFSLVNGTAQDNGTPESESKIITSYFGNEVKGDFDEDGIDDAAFLLTQNTGGSGTFYYLAVKAGSSLSQLSSDTILLGDRIAPQTTEFRDGEIIVNYAERKPNEPMTSNPSVGISRYFKVQGGRLAEQVKTSPSHLVLPIAEYGKRLTFKVFGQYVQDRFTGYHAGDDIEYQEETKEVPVISIADGTVAFIGKVSGYGGLIIIKYSIDGKTYHALYGHIDLSSSDLKKGDPVDSGQFLANLGDNKSAETDGERKHLHFGLYEGEELRYRGYETNQEKVSTWINPYNFFLMHGVNMS